MAKARLKEGKVNLESKLAALLRSKRFNITLAAEVARGFLVDRGEPTDMVHGLVAMKAVHDLWEAEHRPSLLRASM